MEFQPNNPLQVILKMLMDDIFAEREQQQQVRAQPNRLDMSKYILNYVDQTPVGKGRQRSELYNENTSVVGKLFGFLGRGVNAVASAFKTLGEDQADTERRMREMGIKPQKDIHGRITNVPQEVLKAKKPNVGKTLKKSASEAGQGLLGRRKENTFSDVIAAQRGGQRDAGVAAGGFLADVVLDPLNLIPIARPLKALGDIATRGGQLARTFEQANRFSIEQAALKAAEDIRAEPFIISAEDIASGAVQAASTGSKAVQGVKGIVEVGQIPSPVMREARDFTGITVPRSEAIDILSEKYPKLNNLIGQNRRLAAISREAGKKHEATRIAEELAQPEITRAQHIVEKIAQGHSAAIQAILPKPQGLGKTDFNEVFEVIKLVPSYSKFGPQEQVGVFKKLFNIAARKEASRQALKEVEDLEKGMRKNFPRAEHRAKVRSLEAKKLKDPVVQAKASNSARRMLYAMTNMLEAKGVKPLGLTGEYMRLSEFIDEFAATRFGPGFSAKTQIGSDILDGFIGRKTDAGIAQAFENLRAKRMVGQSGSLAAIAGLTNRKILDTKATVAPAIAKVFNEKLAHEAEKAVLGVGSGVPVEAKAVRQLAEQLVEPTDLRDIAVKATGAEVAEAMGKGITHREAIQKLSNAIEKSRGFHYEEAATKLASEQGSHWDSFLDRITTWNGAEEVRPVARTYIDSAKASAALMADILHPLSQKFNQGQLAEAFKYSQGLLPELSDPALREASDAFSGIMAWMFKISGMPEDASRASSIAYRSNLVMKDLNNELEHIIHSKKWSFTTGTRKNELTGEVVNFGGSPTKWLESWIFHKVDNPIEYTYQIALAVQRVTTKYAFLDEAAARWGTKVARGNVEVGHHRLSGVYFSPELGKQITKTLRRLDEFYTANSQASRNLAAAMSIWKRWVTIMRPGHHSRNIIGDWFNAYLDGVSSPRYYTKAMKVVKAHRQFYKEALKDQNFEAIEYLVGRPNADLTRKIADLPGDVSITTAGGLKLTNEQIYLMAHRKGILPRAAEIEDIYGGPAMISSSIGETAKKVRELSPFKGQVTDKVAHWSELREHWMRLGHFIGVLEKSTTKNLDLLAEEAALRVKKWHPDGMDLTGFEQKIRANFIPFYSWNRKIVPLMIEGLVQKPGHILNVAKVPFSIQEMLGLQPASYENPFTGDQLYPQWIRAGGIGPIGDPTLDGLPGWLGRLGRYPTNFLGQPNQQFTTVVNPGTPFTDTLAQYTSTGGIGSGILQMISPSFKVPAEVLMDQTALSQRPVSSNVGRYILEQVPVVSDAARIASVGRPNQSGVAEGLLNYLFGTGIRGTGVYQNTAQFEQKEAIRKKRQ